MSRARVHEKGEGEAKRVLAGSTSPPPQPRLCTLLYRGFIHTSSRMIRFPLTDLVFEISSKCLIIYFECELRGVIRVIHGENIYNYTKQNKSKRREIKRVESSRVASR